MTIVDISALEPWIGKQEVLTDTVTPAPVAGLSAALNYPETRAVVGDRLPTPWHWLYFWPTVASSDVDQDGHPKRGGFLPPVPLPRRMWAGSRITYQSELLVGDVIKRVSTITNITLKQGRTDQLVFVTLKHDIFTAEKLVISEQQDLVYCEAVANNRPPLAKSFPDDPMWSLEVQPNPVLLFRYSALTFNSHRIHYDRDFAMQKEGYGGLVVHGPLTATLLLDLLYREMPEAQLVKFQFRGISPLFDNDVIHLQGRRDDQKIRLWALNGAGELAMTAEANLNSQ